MPSAFVGGAPLVCAPRHCYIILLLWSCLSLGPEGVMLSASLSLLSTIDDKTRKCSVTRKKRGRAPLRVGKCVSDTKASQVKPVKEADCFFLKKNLPVETNVTVQH